MNTSITQVSTTAAPATGQGLLLGLLWLGVIGSALGVIYVSHDARHYLNTLETLRREQSQLQLAWGQYLLEESTWSAYGRVEKLAAEKLSMAVPTANHIVTVTPDEG